jgi:hypothetical protein
MENGFFGPLPAEMGIFQSLQNLTLSLNFFSGVIPVELGTLEELSKSFPFIL